MKFFAHATVSALCYSLVRELCLAGPRAVGAEPNDVVRFVLAQQGRMPDLLRLPMLVLTVVFDVQSLLKSGVCFHQLPHEQRWQHILAWKHSRLGVRRDLIRFYESLAVLGWYSLVWPQADSAEGGKR